MPTSDSELQKTFDALVESTDAKRISSGDFKGTCPSHDDQTASLSLGLTDDKIILNCYAGCDFKTIVRSLNISTKDLSTKNLSEGGNKKSADSNPEATRKQPKLKYKEVERYRYELYDGTPLFVVIRQEVFDDDGKKHKNFPQTKVDLSGNIVGKWTMKDTIRVPYHLPELRKAIQANKPILLVEGEKDVHSAEKLGFTVTTIPGGAKSSGGEKVIDECSHWFKGSDLLLCPDNDESGKP